MTNSDLEYVALYINLNVYFFHLLCIMIIIPVQFCINDSWDDSTELNVKHCKDRFKQNNNHKFGQCVSVMDSRSFPMMAGLSTNSLILQKRSDFRQDAADEAELKEADIEECDIEEADEEEANPQSFAVKCDHWWYGKYSMSKIPSWCKDILVKLRDEDTDIPAIGNLLQTAKSVKLSEYIAKYLAAKVWNDDEQGNADNVVGSDQVLEEEEIAMDPNTAPLQRRRNKVRKAKAPTLRVSHPVMSQQQ